ncbi:hypothetical protein BD324DRAFT_574682 [Kockovaella imperatae]|uniref:Indoleamine 2,3-dioxygenase n=1 Tax=Kockovaella imperatae TaxID=4999 RepID=A0A1Y1USA6_9TREE|nr:hypothetical protein BD324DRAFT_574682 [Kockovaella imperatae]ORX40879.1 hypothetical protein BD324DRAFT_574682 [Kockovaella imperatae]
MLTLSRVTARASSTTHGQQQRLFASVSKAPIFASNPHVLEDLEVVRNGDKQGIEALPPFVVSRERGFLPRQDPMVNLPPQFKNLDSLLDRMTIHQPAKSSDPNAERAPGLLALGQFGDAVESELKVDGPEMKAVKDLLADPQGRNHLIAALFRDYCFAVSSYLLEPTDQAYRKTGKYVPGRKVLPAQLAVPITQLAENLGHFPFMEYASSYALQNWKVKDPNFKGPAGRLSFDNLELIRAFEDAQGSERGFILVHVEMVAFTNILISATEDALAAIHADDVKGFENAFERLLGGYQKINRSMDTMWGRSKNGDYMKFRTFIYGTAPKKGNPMFPEGVVYEGVSEEPQWYRGESGANDNIIPLNDNLLEIVKNFPKNPLTEQLREFRKYRPASQRDYVNTLEFRAQDAGVRDFAMRKIDRLTALYILLVEQNREFRNRHWNFTKEYIIKHTKFPLATGGSPIIKYLPHNLDVVLRTLEESYADFTPMDTAELVTRHGFAGEILAKQVEEAGVRAQAQRRVLDREVKELSEARDGGDNGMAQQYDTTAVDKVFQDVKKPPQRGWVGNDGVG